MFDLNDLAKAIAEGNKLGDEAKKVLPFIKGLYLALRKEHDKEYCYEILNTAIKLCRIDMETGLQKEESYDTN